MHQYINEMKEHEFVLWVIAAEGFRKNASCLYRGRDEQPERADAV